VLKASLDVCSDIFAVLCEPDFQRCRCRMYHNSIHSLWQADSLNLSCDGAVICSWHDYFRQCPLFHKRLAGCVLSPPATPLHHQTHAPVPPLACMHVVDPTRAFGPGPGWPPSNSTELLRCRRRCECAPAPVR